jgi:hypothetical protein
MTILDTLVWSRPTHLVAIRDYDGDEPFMRNLLRTDPIPAGTDVYEDHLTIHVEISGDPLPHGPDEMEPVVCINIDRPQERDLDQARIEISDPDSLDQLIAALNAARPVLRQLRKEAGL